jgi:hypothetical protein
LGLSGQQLALKVNLSGRTRMVDAEKWLPNIGYWSSPWQALVTAVLLGTQLGLLK